MSQKSGSIAVRPSAIRDDNSPGDGADADRILSIDQNAEASDSESERLRGMAELSSGCFWELNCDFRVSHVWCGSEAERLRGSSLTPGKALWDHAAAPLTGSWDEHRAQLVSHQSFDDLIVKWDEPDGSIGFSVLTGRPRFAAGGEFLGYVGISRDVTNDVNRQRLMELEIAVAKVMGADSGFEKQLEDAMHLVCRGLDWSFGRLWDVQVSTCSARLVVSTRSDEDRPGACSVRERFAEICRSGRLAWISADSTSSGGEPADPPAGVLVPVSASFEVMAVLEFRTSRVTQPTGALALLLTNLALQIGSLREREVALDRLRDSEQLFANTVELAAIGICHIGAQGQILHANHQLTEILGYSRDELLGKTVKEISHVEDRDTSSQFLAPLLAREIESFRIEKRYIRKSGEAVWVRINTVINWDKQGKPRHHISIVEDISDRKAAEAKVAHLATHDSLTGLPNRALFNELLDHAVRSAGRNTGQLCAVLFIDLDRFKSINDSLGHQSGDDLLTAVAGSIRENIRSTDCAARLGGDEFVVLLREIDSPSSAEAIALKILQSLQKPIRIRSHDCRVTASIGVAVCPEDGDDSLTLTRNADTAMYAAKQSGRNDVQRYSADMMTMSVQQITLETHLRRALERNEFRVQYQRRVDAKTGQVVGAEALLRWWNSELGTIPPVQFLPVAEETGLAVEIGGWVIREACHQCVSWHESSQRPVFTSVNLSAVQFRDPGLLACLRECLEAADLEAGQLELEIAESVWAGDIEQSIAIATTLRDLGVRVAIDELGTGFSALEQLERWPIDTLKIDRSVTRDLISSEENRSIVHSTIAMARKLGIVVVGEGVETGELYSLLQQLGCDQLQGYYIGRPCNARALAQVIRDR